MIQLTPSPVVDYIALAVTGLVIVAGLVFSWWLDRRERAHDRARAAVQDAERGA